MKNKKIKSLIATLLVFVVCFSFNVAAAEKDEFESVDIDDKQFLAVRVSYSSIFEQYLVDAVKNYKSEIDVSKFSINADNLPDILYDISNKYPEYFYFDLGNTYYSISTQNTVIRLKLSYYYSKNKSRNMQAEVERAIKKPLSQIE
ncbi:MAG: hypothetical protein IJO19_05050, partial [Clostridia bacterium]|nr:hypothetical protein [Clostridia bacterium]